MNAPAVFSFDSSFSIRVIDQSGEPWFVASDVCAALSLDPTAIRKLDTDEKGLRSMQTPGGVQEIAIINESGLYTLILRCRDATKPGTVPHRFRKWVTGEVLPAIRKTGRYQVGAPAPEPVEYISTADQTNLARCIDGLCSGKRQPRAWGWASWYGLRQATGVAAPGRFEVRHLPCLAAELQRQWMAADALDEALWQAEREFLRRVFRLGEEATAVVDELRARTLPAARERAERVAAVLAPWRAHELAALTERRAPREPLERYPFGLEPQV